MNDDRQQHNDVSPESAQQTEQAGLSRRKFAKLGALSVPVAMSLSSKTALGANYICTLSGALSGNLSHPGYLAPCFGRTPGYWGGGNPHMVWPVIPGFEGYPRQQDVPFHSIFAGQLFMWTALNDQGQPQTRSLTLYEVIMLQGGNTKAGGKKAAATAEPRDPAQVGAHTVAALLNALATEYQTNGFGEAEYGMTPAQVIALYNDNIGNAGFTQVSHDAAAGDSSVQALKTLFQEWNENTRDVNKIAGLFGP